MRRSGIILAAALFVLGGTRTEADFNKLETEHLRLLYYGELQSYVVPHVARCFENAYQFHSHLFRYKSGEKVTVLLHDFSDYGNAGAGTVPRNHISVAIAPASYAFETTPSNERINSTLNHELAHIVQLDNPSGSDQFFRRVFFGKVAEIPDQPETILYGYLTAPQRSTPRWYREGIAVFLETWMAGGLGRAQGGYDEMVFRTMVRDSAHIYDLVGLESEGTKIDFQGGVNSYLYGTRFMSYLAYQYGPDKLIEWTNRVDGGQRYFAAHFKSVYGMSLGAAWSEWIEWERGFQRSNLDTVKAYRVTECRRVSPVALGSVSRGIYDSNKGLLYAAVNYPGQIAYLAAIDLQDGSVERICDIKGAAMYFVSSLAFDPASGTLFFTTDNNEWRDLVALDLNTGKSKVLQKDARIGDLSFNETDSSLWGVRNFNGITTLVRIPYPYSEWNQVYSVPFGREIHGIDLSPDGSLLSAGMVLPSGQQTLVMWQTARLLEGDTTSIFLHDFHNSIPVGFVFSPDCRYLYGSSYYTGVSNLFRYDLLTDSMDCLTNVESGLFYPVPISDDSLLAFEYTGKGFLPVMVSNAPIYDVNPITYLGRLIAEKHPVVRSWKAGSPGRVDLDTLITYRGPYHALSQMGVVSAYPIIQGYDDYPAYGARVNISGPIGLNAADLTVTYTPNSILPEDERLHAGARFSHMEWTVTGEYNGADFYDLFGPTKTSRKGYSLGLGYKKSLLWDGPKQLGYNLHLTGYGGLERLPAYQNITTSYDRFLEASGSLNYQNLQASIGAVDYEKGLIWQGSASSKYVNGKLFPRVHSNFDYGLPLPVSHSSIWLRTSTGYSPSDRDEPLGNFYFGGFGNNWIDHQSVKRYRRYYSFPGVELNEVGGTTFGKAMLELNWPPLRFRKMGMSSFYATWARLAFFSSGIVTNVDSESFRRELINAGAQLDIRLIMLSHLNLTLSVGYAAAFEKEFAPRDEFMFSVKLL
jgi:hypothetical protein